MIIRFVPHFLTVFLIFESGKWIQMLVLDMYWKGCVESKKLRNLYQTQNNACYAIYAICVLNGFYGLLICAVIKSLDKEMDSNIFCIYYLSFQ